MISFDTSLFSNHKNLKKIENMLTDKVTVKHSLNVSHHCHWLFLTRIRAPMRM